VLTAHADLGERLLGGPAERPVILALQKMREPEDRVERSAQLVAQPGQKPRTLGIEIRGPREVGAVATLGRVET